MLAEPIKNWFERDDGFQTAGYEKILVIMVVKSCESLWKFSLSVQFWKVWVF